MSNLLVEKITNDNSVDIDIRISESLNVLCIRPHVMIIGNLTSGTMCLEIKEGSYTLTTTEIDYTLLNDVKESSENIRGFVRFDTNTVLNHNTDNDYTQYTISIYMKNFTDNDTNYVSVVSDLDQTIDLHDDDSKASMNLEIYTI